ncbi:MBL fold metallo-hydrolase [Endozoicomonas ascidiicola]|uniref:MBL fold metallo-hydrolase n=1 Tax=Endozoicomonas ascidiicola TaxID=1698521 RepID=UPI000A64759E|nr:MBL fold metallo-hydrolase [Endozoicomonas ascidiicola]
MSTTDVKTEKSRKVREREALEYPHTAPEADGSVVQLADGLLWARMPMSGSLSHINVYLLEDHDGWWIVDTGLCSQEISNLWLKIAESVFSEKPLKAVICTHFHYDHAGQARWLSEHFKVPVYMTHGEYFTMRVFFSRHQELGGPDQYRYYQKAGLEDSLIKDIFRVCSEDPFIIDGPSSFIRLSEGQTLNIGDRAWQIVIGNGHSPEHACLYSEQDKLLIAGDQLLPTISSNVLVTDIEPFGNPLACWMDSLDRLDGLHRETLALPAHGLVFRNIHERTAQLRNHHVRQLDIIRKKMLRVTSATTYQVMGWLFRRQLSPMDQILAVGETLAHINWLIENKELTLKTDENGVNQYSKI